MQEGSTVVVFIGIPVSTHGILFCLDNIAAFNTSFRLTSEIYLMIVYSKAFFSIVLISGHKNKE